MIFQIINTTNKSNKVLIDLSVLVAGLLLPFSFAPYNQFWLMLPLLAWLFVTVVDQKPFDAFKRGWLFGFGWLAHGVSWIYYSLHVHGGAPFILAAIIIGLLCVYLAVFPGLALYFARRFFNVSVDKQLIIIFPLMFMLGEWLRGYFLTGFPWLQLGYAQIDTPLAGYAPVIGGLGVTWLIALSSALLVLMFVYKQFKIAVPIFAAVWLIGVGLLQINWTEPDGEKIKVSLIQGNIEQKIKWSRHMHEPTLNMYQELTRQHWDSDLIIWPETAIPDFYHRVPYYISTIKKEAEEKDTDVLFGIFIRDQKKGRYYNSLVSIRDGVYQKRHLVPLGEFYPFRGLLEFFSQWINIPMSDVDFGPDDQELITAAGQKIGVSICFEDAFDRDVLMSLPDASLLVNVSNDAWFEKSAESMQHHQIARMRALETGRYMLRSTNTGVSSIIDEKGQVLEASPAFERHVLTAEVQAFKGSTPYVIWQNYLLVGLSLFGLVAYYFKLRKS